MIEQRRQEFLFGTGDHRLIALDAKTGKPADGFGDNGVVNLRAGVTGKFPHAAYGISAPPAVYRNIVMVGAGTQEGPSLGPSVDPRAFDARTGKLMWTFHTVPRPGEPGNEHGAGWMEGSVRPQPVGSRYHDIWDCDLSAPPALIDVKHDGKTIPALAEITKMGLLFILNRETGKPVFGVEDRPVPKSDTPGEELWPTEPFPIKPPPLARMSLTKDQLSKRMPESENFAVNGSPGFATKVPTHPVALRRRSRCREPWVEATGEASHSTPNSALSS